MKPYQPKTGQKCHCKPGQHRDNCPDCEGTGQRIDFAAIRAANAFYSARVRALEAEGMTTSDAQSVIDAERTP